MVKSDTKYCLVVSYGPVPTPQYQTIEGGGMRTWGMAKGLRRLGAEVTVAINASFPQEVAEHEGIKLVNWSPDQDFAALINTFDAVIVSYCMGSDSVFIADHIGDNVQLILDCYVPIYVEVSAREAEDIDTEYSHYMGDVSRYNHVLKRGDYFLCASQTQKLYYTGVLSSLGIINPRSYRQNRILIAPFGIHDTPPKAAENPYKDLGVNDDDFLVLWFGGLYPWFRVDEYLEAVKELAHDKKLKFAIVGGKNPFNPNPAFSQQYEYALEFAGKNKLEASLLFVDWVDFDKRIDWYKRADIVISINQPGEENTFAWRTRVMDYVWGELPILTNGGDPLSEDLLSQGAAIRLEELSKDSMVKTISKLTKDKELIKKLGRNLSGVKEKYYWHNVMKPVSEAINQGFLPNQEEAAYRERLGVMEPEIETSTLSPAQKSKFKKYINLSRKTVSYARRKGLKRSAYLAYNISKTQFRRRVIKSRARKYVFVSHPINHTGAPLVLVKMVEEYALKYGSRNVRVITPGIEPDILASLRKRGIRIEKAAQALNDRMIDLQLGLNKGDFLLMNTLAIYPNYRGFIMRALASGQIEHAYWFIHEDIAQLSLVASELLDKKQTAPITELANKGKLTLLVPSKRVKYAYEKLWGIKDIKVVHLHVDVPDKYKRERPVSDYKNLHFLLSGTAADARKGQLIAISAFYDFVKNYYEKDPKKYRDFKLSLVGVADDYVSQQIKIIARSLLDKKVDILPSIPHNDALKLTAKCNAVICCSLNETFGLYVAEGMFMGHVLLRNNSAGMEEQLKDGVNGYYIDTTDVKQFSATIERLLNKRLTGEQLKEMGEESKKIISSYANNQYVETIENTAT